MYLTASYAEKKKLNHFSAFSGPELLQLLVLLKCPLAMIHILSMLLDKANIKQQVRHWGKMAKQYRTMLQQGLVYPGNFLLPMGNREILFFAQIIHRFIAMGTPQV